jgi:hypothetical protein
VPLVNFALGLGVGLAAWFVATRFSVHLAARRRRRRAPDTTPPVSRPTARSLQEVPR